MTRDQFLNATRLLWNLDGHELIDAGVLDKNDLGAWGDFCGNPHRWAARADDETMDKLWALMRRKSDSLNRAACDSRPVYWEDVSHLLCHCGQDHCDAANHAPDHDMSADRYVEKYGCGTTEVYEAAQRVAAFINKRFALSTPDGRES